MGGCVSCCFSCCDGCKQVDDKIIAHAKLVSVKSAEVAEPKENGFSLIRRSPSMSSIPRAEWNAKFYGSTWGNLPKMLQEVTIDKFASTKKAALAWRAIKEVKKEKVKDETDGKEKEFEITYLGDRESMNYNEMWNMMHAFALGLEEIGLSAGNHVGIYEETSMPWMVSCYGIWIAHMIGVTVYANLGDDALVYAMKEAELPAIICNANKVAHLLQLCSEAGIEPPIIIYIGILPAKVDTGSAKAFEWKRLCDKGMERMTADPSLKRSEFDLTPDDTALIMYTSGTTGDPKGVVITHGNMIAAILGFGARLNDIMTLHPDHPEDDAYVAYLPLAHSLEFAAENVMMSKGITIGYGGPRTLTDKTAKPHGDLTEYKPSFFAGVPRIYETIRKAVLAKVPESGAGRAVFDRAYADRVKALKNGKDTPFYNEKVFSKMHTLLGGRCKVVATGAAPLAGTTQEFLEVCFGVKVMQGYGLTETCACGTLQRYGEQGSESIGGMLSPVEVRLRDVQEGNFLHTDNPPRGEICLRGAVVTKGYYKQPEKTKEAYDDDGWFYTGDVGQFEPDGTVKIIGRVKALAKNALGEYIALESLETTYGLNDLCVPNGVCVLVHPHRAYIACIACTDETKAKKFAKEHNIEGDYPAVVSKPEFQKAAQKSLADTAQKQGKKPMEQVKAVKIVTDEWTPENGVLTAAMKLKRREIDARYTEDITALFAQE